ncbi:MAG: hypothetical protein GY779_16235, partial [Gammaproteobacteria bacterium]|nr:hypothetical protein [Gammaproteobacteria bacterium]
ATEFETPESMPAKLPPNSAYTYCSELYVDGASKVRFNKPVVVYVDNFLGFGVGGAVPVGYYDMDRAVWVPSDNGVVVKLLDTDADGIVDALDADGDDLPDDLNSDGFFNDEVSGLDNPVQYSANATYWRFEAGHFTPWDCNWPYGPPADAIQSNGAEASVDQQEVTEDSTCEIDYTSSYVERRSRIFHEDIPIPGTDFTLHYASNRVSGYKSVVTIPVSGASLPASLKEIKVTLHIAGQVFEQTLSPLPDQKVEFIWDGLDHLGNSVAGSIKADVRIGFVYDAVYITPGNFAQAFAQAGTNVTGIRSRQEIISWKNSSINIYRSGGNVGTIAKGWTLSAHHSWFQYSGNTLNKGDGTTINNTAIITTEAGNGQEGYSGDGGLATEAKLHSPVSITLDSIGNMYIADSNNRRIRKVDTNGIITTVAGNGQSNYTGDGGLATEAALWGLDDITMDSLGNMYIADPNANRIRKVDTNGIITTVAGNGQWGNSGDGGPADESTLSGPTGVAVDSIGNIYIANTYTHRIRKVDTNGIITTVAGNGQYGYSGDGGPAIEAEIDLPRGVVVDSAGNIYIADSRNQRIRKMDTSGIITTVAGIGQRGYSGDGGPAVEAMLFSPSDIAVDGIGNIYIMDAGNQRIRKVDTKGIITTVAGNGQWGYSGDGGLATEATMHYASDVAVDSTGTIYIPDSWNNRLRKVSFPETLPISAGENAFTDENGLGYIMDSAGLHKSTIDLFAGITLLTFGYNVDSQLESITDRFNNQTTIQRDTFGVPFSITSPDGIVTGLTVDGDNHLTQVTNPDTTGFSFTYDPSGGGLMTDEYDQNDNHFIHDFDVGGKVTDVFDPEGGAWHYSRSVDSNGIVTTTVLTGESSLTTYLDRTESTGASTSVKTGPDGSISTITRASDGITETNELSCGMTLDMKYDIDSEYAYKYLKDITKTSPAGLALATTNSKTYVDTNTDNIPDLITNTVDINGKGWTSADNSLTGMITNTSPLGKITTVRYN